MTLYIPNMVAALVDKAGKIIPPWNSFFQQFANPPANIIPILLGASPSSYVVKQPGMVVISGGTVTGVSFTRGLITIGINAFAFPVEIADIVTVAYSILPTISLVPRY